MDEHTFQHELRQLKHRVSELSSASSQFQACQQQHQHSQSPLESPATRGDGDLFLDQLAHLKRDMETMRASLLHLAKQPEYRPAPPRPQLQDTFNMIAAANASAPAASNPEVFWQMFSALRDEVQAMSGRVAGLENAFESLEDRVDRFDPERFTPPGSAMGMEEDGLVEAQNAATAASELSGETVQPTEVATDAAPAALLVGVESVHGKLVDADIAMEMQQRNPSFPTMPGPFGAAGTLGYINPADYMPSGKLGQINPAEYMPPGMLGQINSGQYMPCMGNGPMSMPLPCMGNRSVSSPWHGQVPQDKPHCQQENRASEGQNSLPWYGNNGVPVDQVSEYYGQVPQVKPQCQQDNRASVEQSYLSYAGLAGYAREENGGGAPVDPLYEYFRPNEPAGPDSVAFGDREITHLEEVLKNATEQIKIRDSRLAVKDRQIHESTLKLEDTRTDLKEQTAWRRSISSGWQRQQQYQEKQAKAKDVQLADLEASRRHFIEKYVDENGRYKWLQQKTSRESQELQGRVAELESALRESLNNRNEELQHAATSKKELTAFCEQKDVVIQRLEKLVARGKKMIEQRDLELENLNYHLVEKKDTEIERLNRQIRQQDCAIEGLNRQIEQGQLEQRSHTVVRLNEQVMSQHREIERLNEQIKQRDFDIERIGESNTARDYEIERLSGQIKQRDLEIEGLNGHIKQESRIARTRNREIEAVLEARERSFRQCRDELHNMKSKSPAVSVQPPTREEPPTSYLHKFKPATREDTPSTKPTASSYWSMPEQADFAKFVAYFGTNFAAMAAHMGTKTETMIKNHYERQIEGGRRPDLELSAQVADYGRERGDDMGDPPTSTPSTLVAHAEKTNINGPLAQAALNMTNGQNTEKRSLWAPEVWGVGQRLPHEEDRASSWSDETVKAVHPVFGQVSPIGSAEKQPQHAPSRTARWPKLSEQDRQNAQGRWHQSTLTPFMTTPPQAPAPDSSQQERSGAEAPPALPRRPAPLDPTLMPPLPAPVQAGRMFSVPDLRASSKSGSHAANERRAISKHASVMELPRRRLQAYVETEVESGEEK